MGRKRIGWLDFNGRADPIEVYTDRRGRITDIGGDPIPDHLSRLFSARQETEETSRRGWFSWF